ncbi:DUF262 domain-containing protein [Pseudomonas putida]|uniref:DUF262 domain-containing protein n=1 Tax=Pseudomonas putida TaxID=303 RepID=UPI000C9CF113|nr:DUF262 domain-containing protein [Pseudomonas putida]PNG84214.1 hypothetical protein CBL13_04066 [Pseudomonas putida]
MQSELKSISKIFSEVIFRIPDYQRGYSWEEKHLKDFWSDIEQLPKGNNHYTGVLTLEPVTEANYSRWDDDLWIITSKRWSPMYVVDGQQRLTTAIILLQGILDQLDDDELLNFTTKADIRKKYIFEPKGTGISKSYIFGYEKDNPSYEFLKQAIFGDHSINHSLPEETIYTKNLRRAKEFFKEKLDTLDRDQLAEVFTVVTQHLHFNLFYIEKDLDVFVTFETMNNRGKPLSHLELLKNRLIYLSTKFEVEEDDKIHLRKSINESWKSVYHYLGKVDSKTYDDDNFLRIHYICYFAKKILSSIEQGDYREYSITRQLRNGQVYKEKLLNEIFTPKHLITDDENKKLNINNVFEYAKSIKQVINIYYQVAQPNDSTWSDKEKFWIERINRIEDEALFVTTVAILLKAKPSKAREATLGSIERLGFLSKINGYYFSDVNPTYLAIQFLAGKNTLSTIKKRFDEATNLFCQSQEFNDSIKNVGKESGGGYYGWRQIRYFMFEYELELKRLSKTTRQLLTWSPEEKTESYSIDHKTIEHIYPQTASDKYWKETFSDYSIKERNVLRNSLGNLLPVSHGKNASLSNKAFELKKGSESNQVGYRYGCLSEIQVSMSPEWSAREILRRGILLLEFMEKRWNLQIGDALKKADLLGLTFVLSREGITVDELLESTPKIPKPPKQRVEDREDAQEF